MHQGKLKWHVVSDVQTKNLEDKLRELTDAHEDADIFDVVYNGSGLWTIIMTIWVPIGSARDFMRAVKGQPGVVLEMTKND